MSAVRAVALTTTLTLVVVLSLDWFAFDPPREELTAEQRASGLILVLNGYSLKGFHASGWAGLGWLPVAMIGLAAAGVVIGLGRAALVGAVLALGTVVVSLATRDDTIALRWPAYAGLVLTVVLLICAFWSSRRAAAHPA